MAEHSNKEEIAKRATIKLQLQDDNNNSNSDTLNNKQQQQNGKNFLVEPQTFFNPLLEFEPHEIVSQVVRELHAEKNNGKNNQMQEKNSHTVNFFDLLLLKKTNLLIILSSLKN